MDYVTLFTTAFIVGFSGAMMPGPMLTVTISETPRRGFWVGPQMVLGHSIVELLLVVCLAGGFTYYLQQPIVIGSIGLVGGVVLLWFGWGIYKSAKSGDVSLDFSEKETNTASTNKKLMHPWVSGVILSLTNPYWSLWWATVGVSYVIVAMNLGVTGLIMFFTGHILADLLWYALVSFIVDSGRNLISDKIYLGVLKLCAAFLVVLGCWFSYDGFQKLTLL
ncbi:MAG: Lysine exporter protein [Firmicutes bacterium]|nr:Lysine exporter protein [Bacillota bacterium]